MKKQYSTIGCVLLCMTLGILAVYLSRDAFFQGVEEKKISPKEWKGNITQNKAEQQRIKQEIKKLESTFTQCIEDEKRLKEVEGDIKQAEDIMFDVQDRALYVGKFICKVNTCQGNPKDENYPAFIEITERLVEVKDTLVNLKKEKENLQQQRVKKVEIQKTIEGYKKQMQDLKSECEKMEAANIKTST